MEAGERFLGFPTLSRCEAKAGDSNHRISLGVIRRTTPGRINCSCYGILISPIFVNAGLKYCVVREIDLPAGSSVRQQAVLRTISLPVLRICVVSGRDTEWDTGYTLSWNGM